MSEPDLQFKRKEAKPAVTLRVTDKVTGVVVNVSSALISFAVKRKAGASKTEFSKSDSDFSKAGAATGVLVVGFTSTDLDRVGTFLGELKLYFSATNIDKSGTIVIQIDESITD